MLVAEKLRVDRSEVIRNVQEATGVDLESPKTDDEIEAAIASLDALRQRGL